VIIEQFIDFRQSIATKIILIHLYLVQTIKDKNFKNFFYLHKPHIWLADTLYMTFNSIHGM